MSLSPMRANGPPLYCRTPEARETELKRGAAIRTSGDQRRTAVLKQRDTPLNKNNSRKASKLYGCFISALSRARVI
jgi:hypothetical protein